MADASAVSHVRRADSKKHDDSGCARTHVDPFEKFGAVQAIRAGDAMWQFP